MESQSTAQKKRPCAVCGEPCPRSLGDKPRKYCSNRCSRTAGGRAPKSQRSLCQQCGRPVHQDIHSTGRMRRYCSDSCRLASAAAARSAAAVRSCARCGIEFVGSKTKVFCSRRCRWPDQLSDPVKCTWCGKEFVRDHHTARSCSPVCAKASRAASTAKRNRKRRRHFQCLCCGVMFSRYGRGRDVKKYCTRHCAFEARRLGLPCTKFSMRRGSPIFGQLAAWFYAWGNDAVEAACKRRGISGHKARCRYYAVPYQPIKEADIYKRDDWTCVYCGVSLDGPWSSGSDGTKMRPDMATIDHIFPLSMGPGSPGHVPHNVASCCNACNMKKAARDPTGWSWPLPLAADLPTTPMQHG